MAAAAARVAELPLDRGEVRLTERVAGADTLPGTEIGQVGAAFNSMLGNVEGAPAAVVGDAARLHQVLTNLLANARGATTFAVMLPAAE